MEHADGKSQPDLVGIARLHRNLLRVAGASLGAIILLIAGSATVDAGLFGPGISRMPEGVWFVAGATCTIVLAVQCGRLDSTTSGSSRWRFAVAVILLGPLLGLLPIFIVDQRARRVLRERGVRVGLLGVSKEHLHELVDGHCVCGYSTEGLRSGVCPECGRALDPAPVVVRGS